MPFIEGYARAGDWEEARRLTLESHAIDPQYKQALCALWQSLDHRTLAGGDKETVVADVRRELSCQP
ncbi:MAG: hypothetical protein U1B80_06455 [Anaerolineaceae bacterium]|nr:hypothetical protein [Anaerolineaceae bacterium]